MMAMDQMPAEGQAQGGGEADTAQVFNDVANGLAVVTDAVMKSQAPDDIKQRMQGVMQEYVGILQDLIGGGGEMAEAQGGGAVPMEQVGQPYSPAGV